MKAPAGDCFSRCVCELSGEPYIRTEWPGLPDESPEAWRAYLLELHDFLYRHGWALLVVDLLSAARTDESVVYDPFPNVVFIAGGLQHDGVRHAVVMNGEELVYDPHPEARGLETIEDRWYLLPTDPYRWFDLGQGPVKPSRKRVELDSIDEIYATYK